jgi:ComF family protein
MVVRVRHAVASFLASLSACAACGRSAAGADGLCRSCRDALPLQAHAAREGADGLPVAWLDRYDGVWRDVVHAIKFGGRPRLAAALGVRLGHGVARLGWPVARVVPVPLHRARRRLRGFDQAERIAHGVGEALNRPVWTGVRRVHATRRQARSSAARRRGNVRDAFQAAGVPPVPLLLVDDVWTSGATTRAVRRALLRAGAREVRVAVLVRADAEAGDAPQRWMIRAVTPPSTAPTRTWG